jgi:hypothetical protein
VLLRDALVSALADTDYPIDAAATPIARDDTVTITLQRKSIGQGYTIQYYIAATIQSGAGRVALRATAQVIDPQQRAVNSEVEIAEMDRLLNQLVEQLGRK